MTALVAAVSHTKWSTENRRDCQMSAAAASSFGAVSEVILNGSHHSLVTMLGTTKIIPGEHISPDRREACGDQLIMVYLCS